MFDGDVLDFGDDDPVECLACPWWGFGNEITPDSSCPECGDGEVCDRSWSPGVN